MPSRLQDELDPKTSVKRIKFLERFLIAFGGKKGRDAKIIFKDLNEDKQSAMKITSDAVFNLHVTREEKRRNMFRLDDKG